MDRIAWKIRKISCKSDESQRFYAFNVGFQKCALLNLFKSEGFLHILYFFCDFPRAFFPDESLKFLILPPPCTLINCDSVVYQ